MPLFGPKIRARLKNSYFLGLLMIFKWILFDQEVNIVVLEFVGIWCFFLLLGQFLLACVEKIVYDVYISFKAVLFCM